MICNSYTSYCDRMQNKLQNVRPEKQKNGISYFVTVALLSVLKLTIYDVFIVWLFLCHFRFKQNKKQKDCVSLTLHSMSKIVTVFSCKPSNNERYFTCWKVCYTGRENRCWLLLRLTLLVIFCLSLAWWVFTDVTWDKSHIDTTLLDSLIDFKWRKGDRISLFV